MSSQFTEAKSGMVRPLRIILMICFIALSSSVYANQEQSMDDAFNQTQLIIDELVLIEALGPKSELFSVAQVPDRQARHVLQMAQAILEKTENIKQELGLEVSEVPPLAVKIVKVQDITEILDKITSNIILIKQKKGYCETITMPKMLQNKTASDVYHNLRVIGYQLDKYFEIRATPSDVMRVLLPLVQDIKLLHIKDGFIAEVDKDKIVVGNVVTTPQNVYHEAVKMYQILNDVASNANFKVNGGIKTLPAPKRKIIAEDIILVLYNILGDIHEMKYHLGIANPTEAVSLSQNVTPKELYVQMRGASLLLSTLDD